VVQAITSDDRVARKEFAVTMLEKLDEDHDFLRKIMFSDEATFHVSGKVNKQNIPMWGSEHPHATVEHIRDSPKVNVRRGLFPPVTWIRWKTLSIHSYKNCSLPFSSSKAARHHTGA
jgi:hypothetical protein